MEKDTCKRFLARLSKSILEPFFGYVSLHDDDIDRPGVFALPLLPSPGAVTVPKRSGHVLFSSEGAALSQLMKSHEGINKDDEHLDFRPPSKMISRMKDLHAYLEGRSRAASNADRG